MSLTVGAAAAGAATAAPSGTARDRVAFHMARPATLKARSATAKKAIVRRRPPTAPLAGAPDGGVLIGAIEPVGASEG